MPKLGDIAKDKKWSDIDEVAEGGFADIEPGLYELVITACEAHPDNVSFGEPKPYFQLAWDVASGEHKGAYATSQYPPTTRVYWNEKALGFLKHRLHVLADWNPGFKSTVAFECDRWNDFVGKRFGAVVRRRLYTAGPGSKQPGADRTTMEIATWLNPEDFRDGNFKESLLADNDMREKKTGAQAPRQQAASPVSVPDDYGSGDADVYDEDIPF